MSQKNIPLSQPYLTSLERQLVQQVLESSQLSLGPVLEAFEDRIAGFVQTRYAVGVNSGTSALHLCIKALNIGRGDEVITTPFSFIASANCILYENARPVFVDIDPTTFNLDPNQISQKISPKTKAILPVHVFGLPCDMLRIRKIAAQYNLKIIEDACEAIGASCRTGGTASANGADGEQRRVGGIGQCGAFGFYPNKQITTGEGGVVVTNDSHIAALCRSLRNQGRSENPAWLQHERLGYNYRLNELNSALGLAQMQHIDEILQMRQRVAAWYEKRLKNIEEIFLPTQQPTNRRSWFVYVIRLRENFSGTDRDSIIKKLHHLGVECRSYFPPIHLQPYYISTFGYKRGDFPNAEQIADRTIALPFFTGMSEDQVDRVSTALESILAKTRTRNVYRPSTRVKNRAEARS